MKGGHSSFSQQTGRSPEGTVLKSKKRNVPFSERGFVLVAVVATMVLVAAIALMLSTESAMEAELTGRGTEALQADHLAQAAMQHALWQNESLACRGDFSVPITPFGTHSYEATVTGGGTTTAYSLSVDQDAWIRNDQPTTNNGSDADQHIRFESGNIEQALYRFDLSSLPAGAQINSASASFVVMGGGVHPEGPITIHRVTTDWTEGDATWNGMNGNFESGALAMIAPQVNPGERIEVNLTAQVQAWVNGEPNYGVLLNASNEGVHAQYVSTEGVSTDHPRLDVVVGTAPASPVTIQATGTLANGNTRTLTRPAARALQPSSNLTLQPDATDGSDAEIWLQQPSNNYGTADETWVSRNGTDVTRTLLKFDLDAMPSGAKILSASLSLYHRSGSNPNVAVTAHRISNPWSEDFVSWNRSDNGVNWDTAGGDFDAAAISTTEVGPISSIRYEWDITRLVQGWTDGTYPNYGVALITSLDGAVGERFDTSDHSDPTRRPRLTISYACECGSACLAPQGSGNVLMPVTSTSNPAPGELLRIALIESWGYVVDTTWENNSQPNFNAAIAANDVVYVPATVDPTKIGTKLTNAPIGVINENGGLNDELGLASGSASPVGSAINLSDNSHYITLPFATGPLSIYSASMEGLAVSGTPAPGLQTLADWSGAGGLVALDTGGTTSGGGTAAGRRVLLPMGASIDLSHVNNNGRLIMQRALAWGMNADAGASGNLLMVVGDTGSPSNGDLDRQALLESWGYSVTLIDDGDSQASFDSALAVNDVAFVTEGSNPGSIGSKLTDTTVGIVNEEKMLLVELGFSGEFDSSSRSDVEILDNTHWITSGFALGTTTITTSNQPLTFTNNGSASGAQLLAETNQAASFFEPSLLTLDANAELWGGGFAAGRRVSLPWGDSGFDINALNADGLMIMQRAIEWAAGAGCGSSKPLLFVVSDASNPTSQEAARQTLMASWCYAVTMIDDDATAGEFATAVALNDVIYISQEITTLTVVTKLKDADIGIVNEEYLVSSDLGFGSGTGSGFYNDINIVDNTHYITSDFSLGALALFSPTYDIYTGTGFTLAPDLQVLGEAGSITGLMALETGAALWDAGNAAGRRVQVPWGDDFSALNTDGQTIMQRAIEWAAMSPDPGGPKKVLFVVGSVGGAGPTVEELAHQTLIESWGHTVELIDDDASQAEFDTAAANNDVAFATNDITASRLGTKLVDATIGVVTSEDNLSDEFGLSSSIAWESGSVVEVNDNAHYITSPFPVGTLTFSSGSESLAYVTGTLSPDLGQLASSTSGYGVVTLAAGATMYGGGPAAGRRVQLPWGGTGFDPNNLTADGLTILQRALEWGAGADGGGGGGGGGGDDYVDGLAVVAYDGSDGSLDWSDDQWEEVTESDGPSAGKLFVATDAVVPDGGNLRLVVDSRNERLERPVDLSSFGTAHLSFHYRRESYPTPSDYFAVLVSQNGSTWTEIDRIYGIANDPVYRPAVYEISSYASANTKIAIETGGINNGQTLFVDNVRIGESPPAGCAGIFRDEFNVRSYANNNGTWNWAGDWTEIKESNGPTQGDIQIRNEINNYQLRVRDDGYGLWREVDLSGASAATLILDYKRDGLDNSNDYVTVDVSGDGGSTWTELDRFEGSGSDTLYQFRSYDITAHAAANTRIRFLGSASLGGQDSVWFDDVEIVCSP